MSSFALKCFTGMESARYKPHSSSSPVYYDYYQAVHAMNQMSENPVELMTDFTRLPDFPVTDCVF